MIDAGSTSSKVSVMRWRDWPFRSNGYMEELTMEKCFKTLYNLEPGISASKDSPQMAYNTLKPTLTKLVNKYIPTYKQSSAVLYLGATAGMRLVNLESPLKADAIIDDLRRQLQNTGLTVSNPYSDIRIINGNDEGIFAWITVNYLSKKLGDESGKRPEPPYQMMGALDLGGASTQITFVPADASSALYTGRHHLFGNMYTVYSYSFLCYGKSAGENRIWAEIIGKQTTAFAGFYFVIDFLFPSGGIGLTRDKVKAKVQEFCGMDWKTVAGASVSWALGYVIDASGKIQSLAPKIDLGQTAFIGSVTALSIVFVALLGVLIYLHLKK
ncbi:unnamed protein product [Dibothriocephalus latus]|uniref:Uncharacterized protein n=1 Tax=Dibothriocephalus latus TaxID=60516 RepID=A0A3P6VEM3_DIBLA|nr:unnamed protein product [Dibothriocephalus latus]